MSAGDTVATRLAALRAVRGDAGEQLCLAVRDLVLVCSSSRGGSSLFGELLRRSPDLLTFSAEINPHVTIPTLESDGGCDVLADPSPFAATPAGLGALRGELGNDIGRPATAVDRAALSRHVAWRLTMQWPREAIDPDVVAQWVSDTLQRLGTGKVPDRQQFTLELLARVRAQHVTVNPYRYDLSDDAVAARFPDAVVPAGPTEPPVVEMAPFVLPRAWEHAQPGDAARLPVVATTPRNAFRVPLLARAFPNARIRIVHLTRNPAASINGLRDGWLHRGFFSCRTEQPLAIGGYTDVVGPWGSSWWNYDVPPGWREWTERSLPEVCGYQWRAAHQSTIEAASKLGVDTYRLAFEEVVGSAQRRRDALTSLCRWLDIDPAPLLRDSDLPVVMPTAAPRPRRWEDNAQILQPALRDPALVETARMLGYSDDPSQWE